MIEVRNLLFQPLSFHLQAGKTLHLGSRERVQIEPEGISRELRTAEGLGMVVLTDISQKPITSSDIPAQDSANAGKRRK